MSSEPYKTTFTASIEVKEGPPPVKQSLPLKGVEATASNRYVLEKKEDKKPIQVHVPGGHELKFFALTATRMTYKECGVDKPGLTLSLNGKTGDIGGEQVYICRLGQSLCEFKENVSISAKEGMFECPKDPPEDIVVTVTYGTGPPKNGACKKDDTGTDCAGKKKDQQPASG
jgi:hypothetical protein